MIWSGCGQMQHVYAMDKADIKEAAIMERRVVFTEKAPGALGPYSQAIAAGGLLYVSGQIPLNPESGVLETGAIETQTVQVLENLKAVLEAGGSGLQHVVKTTVFISNMDEFSRINAVYARYFPVNPPARSCVEAARLPKDIGVEIEAIALIAE